MTRSEKMVYAAAFAAQSYFNGGKMDGRAVVAGREAVLVLRHNAAARKAHAPEDLAMLLEFLAPSNEEIR